MKRNITFGEFIKAERRKKKLQIKTVAEMINIETSLLSKIEKNEMKAPKSIFILLSKLYGLNLKSLLIRYIMHIISAEKQDSNYFKAENFVYEEPQRYNDEQVSEGDSDIVMEETLSLFKDYDIDFFTDENSAENVWDKSVRVEENRYYYKAEPIIRRGKLSENHKPVVVELFSGCGGTSLGFEMAGYEIALGCDIHIPSVQTFQKNHPDSATILGDVKKVTPDKINELLNGKNIDVLIAGVPCQGFSLNNRKRHENDERNLLYKEFVRFVSYLKPKVIVLENVSGMKSTGNYVELIEEELSLAGQMKVRSKLLYAPDYGVPQSRSRLVFVGIRNGDEFDFSRIKKTHGPSTDRPYVTVGDAISDLPSLKPGEEKNDYLSEPKTEYQKFMRKNATQKLYNHRAPNHPLEVIRKIETTSPGKPIYPKFKQRIRLAWEMLSPTQVSGGIRPQFQFGHPSDPRGLSIRERCRLQSFPDNFIICGGIVQGRVQTGNAVPPLLAKAIAEAIKDYL